MRIPGSCHCGNLSFTLVWEPDPAEIPARVCGCSFCTKHGGVWTAHPDAALQLRVEDPESVSRYTFETGTAEFQICARCGVVPAVTSRIDGRLYAVVSVNAFHGIDAARIRRGTVSYDGETEATRLERRKRNWIATVEYVTGARARIHADPPNHGPG